jgi:hypothetical protein
MSPLPRYWKLNYLSTLSGVVHDGDDGDDKEGKEDEEKVAIYFHLVTLSLPKGD